MKKLSYLIIAILFIGVSAFTTKSDRLVSKNAHASFYSHTSFEDITANNYKVVSTIDPVSGDVVFSVPMQSFEFEKALMQEHFNGKGFLNTKAHPKAKFVGNITNLSEVDFSKDGTYEAAVKGELTIKGVSNPIDVKGTITINTGIVSINTKFNIVLADYKISFKKGKPSTNVAKEISATMIAEYSSESL